MLDRINYLQLEILIHSYLYYELGESIISDELFDKLSKELVRLQNAYLDDFNKSIHKAAFDNFDGTTGFHLISFMGDGLKKYAEDMLRWEKYE